ncbi:MAG: HD domain-containing protein [Desulfobulbaceae bacterium]|nr:HD domain-containing protein [Desulfobulbaceae bacterium]MCK5405607.1 HD domain-containing protein [Desulfobulbaceae bacterium]
MNSPIPFQSYIDQNIPSEFPLGKDLTTQLLDIASGYYDIEGGCHGLDHSRRVHKTALYIGHVMQADLAIVSAAAILHDIGRKYETKEKGGICHAAKGAELSRPILLRLDFSSDDVEAIVHCIATHRYRGEMAPQSLEARVLFDADKLDSIGATGIGRAFLFAGQIGARLHNHNGEIKGTRSYTTEDTAYREFKVKMCRIKDRMLTPVGKDLALERHGFMELFFDRLHLEVGGEWMSGGRGQGLGVRDRG